ncbi:hypothetical protein GCM10010435_11130 [Winogradskya consettensis]|uniref:Ferritin-like domain-containing protein n=1 Tax=Winogradskya consettensis TaxID=113560 RepID=A0A919VZF8_9ACTN|nr:hypothetical protein Aco04nite_70330 [Actinoplanes consettensis]
MMVLDCHVRRRQVLGAVAGSAGLAALTGCGLFGSDPEPAPPPDALQPVLDEALTLAAAYERAVVASPDLAARLSPMALDHRAHATELAKLIGATLPSGGASGPPTESGTDALAELRKAEQSALKTATAACKAAPGERAALVGSIAAARAAHAEALR